MALEGVVSKFATSALTVCKVRLVETCESSCGAQKECFYTRVANSAIVLFFY